MKNNDSFISSLIKSSASELCIKFLPLWQQNIEIYNDKFSSWEFGEFDYIDPIDNLQDGARTRFPLRVNGELLSFDVGSNTDSQLIVMSNLLAIYINGVLQEPGEAYVFDGGTTFEFTTAPETNDNISITL